MDQRDFSFWSREVSRVRLIEAMLLRAVIHADQDGFKEIVSDLERQISANEGTKGREIAANWNALKEIGRR